MSLPLPEPSTSLADPAQLLLRYLDFFRSEILRKLDGLRDAELRQSRLPSGWSPLELLSHLVHMERRWLVWGFAGEHVAEPWGDQGPDGRWRVGPDVTVEGSVGWGLAENLMRGVVRVRGNASESAAATAHGGTVVVHGDASSRAGISLKGGTLAVAGDVGHMSGFMAQAGTILVGGDAGHALGDSLYEAVVYVGGKVHSLGSDSRIEDLTEDDVRRAREILELAGFDHIDPQNLTRVASAKQLYNFDALKNQRY